jgi:pimeloyl-ACP methyl ester carboxylesterase
MHRIHLILAAAFLVLAIVASLSYAQAPLPLNSPASELWYGKLDAGVREFRFLITINSPLKNPTASLKSFDEGGANFELDKFVFDAEKMNFEIVKTKAVYTGQRSETGDSVSGQWQQGLARLSLKFERVESVPREKPDEVWAGTLNTGLAKLKLQFRIFRTVDEKQLLLMDSLNQNAGGFKGSAQETDGKVVFKVDALGASFSGTRDASGEKLTGKYKQGAGEFDLVLEKKAEPESSAGFSLRRPQTPQAPFPYRSEEVKFDNKSASLKLAGTLTLPEGSGPFPAAILISGSGAQDRDETLAEHKPFLVLADHLTKAGIAVLRYDDRGVGQSTGLHALATTADFTSDALAAFEYLRTRPEIAPTKIGMIGHSEGGLVAPLAAAKEPAIGWIVLLAGPGVNGEQILYSQGQKILSAEGGDSEQLNLQRIFQETLIGLLKSSPSVTDRAELSKKALEQITAKLSEVEEKAPKAEGGSTNPLSDPKSEASQAALKQIIDANLAGMDNAWFRFFIAHEPAPVLEQVKCPVLALNGSKDTQVIASLNLPAIAKALATGGNQKSTIQELPGLNHLFQTCETGGISEYGKIEETISPEVLNLLTKWIGEQQ